MKILMAFIFTMSFAHAYKKSDLWGQWKGDFFDSELLLEFRKDGSFVQELPEVELKTTVDCKVTKKDSKTFQFDCEREGIKSVIRVLFLNKNKIIFGTAGYEDSDVELTRI